MLSPLLLITLAVLVVATVTLWAVTTVLSRQAEVRVPPAGRWIDLSSARLHLIDRGQAASAQAPVLIMIHGLAGQTHHFSYRLIDELAQSYRVIAIDRPGSGYSRWRAGVRHTLDAQVALIDELARHLDLRRVVLVGHSLGGAIALGAAVHYPDRVAGVALLAPLTRLPVGVPPWLARWMARTDWLWRCISLTIATPMLRVRRQRFRAELFAPDPVPADYGVQGGGDLTLRSGQLLAACRDLIALPAWLNEVVSRYDQLGSPGYPTVGMLYGLQDAVLSPQHQGAWFAERVRVSPYRTLDAGHMLPLTRPEACVQLIRQVADGASR